jgi:hypothetical protein
MAAAAPLAIRIADVVAAMALDALPEGTRRGAGRRLLDTLGCALGAGGAARPDAGGDPAAAGHLPERRRGSGGEGRHVRNWQGRPRRPVPNAFVQLVAAERPAADHRWRLLATITVKARVLRRWYVPVRLENLNNLACLRLTETTRIPDSAYTFNRV